MRARLSRAAARVEVEHERSERAAARVDGDERRVLAAAEDRARRGARAAGAARARADRAAERAPDLLGVLLGARRPASSCIATDSVAEPTRAAVRVDQRDADSAAAEVDREDERGVVGVRHEASQNRSDAPSRRHRAPAPPRGTSPCGAPRWSPERERVKMRPTGRRESHRRVTSGVPAWLLLLRRRSTRSSSSAPSRCSRSPCSWPSASRYWRRSSGRSRGR